MNKIEITTKILKNIKLVKNFTIDNFKSIVTLKDGPYDKLICGIGKIKEKDWIAHKDIQIFSNQYRTVETYSRYNLNFHLVIIYSLDAGACGCKVLHHLFGL